MGKHFDLLSVRPTTEKALQWLGGNTNPEIDIVSLDLTQRFTFPFRHSLFTNFLAREVAVEVCYASGIGDTSARRNIISNATQLVRATRGGRGVFVSSETHRTGDLRGPFDVANLATFWGMKGGKMGNAARVVQLAEGRKGTYRGAVQVITAEALEREERERERPKRKVEVVDETVVTSEEKPGKRRKKKKRR
jgi:ribonuclease P/MRP protein subunit RPP1